MEYIYSALLLNKLGKEINEENLKKIIQSVGVEPDESKIKSLVTSLKGIDIEKEISNVSVSQQSSPEKKEEKPKEEKKEEKKELAAEGLAALFG